MVPFLFIQPPTLQPCTLSQPSVQYDKMFSCEHDFSVSEQWRSDEAQSNPSPGDHSLIQTHHHFVSHCVGEICAVIQPAVSCSVVPSYLRLQLLA